MIHIITPCSRLENLPAIYKAVSFPDIDWHLMIDSSHFDYPVILPHTLVKKPAGSVLGNHLKNVALDEITDGWVYVLDDDNQLHPDFLSTVKFLIAENPDKSVFTFDQLSVGGSVRAGNRYEVGKIDQAQYIVKRDFIGDLRYRQSYESDGLFIKALWEKDPAVFLYVPRVLSYYNYFKW